MTMEGKPFLNNKNCKLMKADSPHECKHLVYTHRRLISREIDAFGVSFLGEVMNLPLYI